MFIKIHIKKLLAFFSSVFVLVGIFIVGFALPASAISCTQNFLGNGTQNNPWQIATSDQLDCFAAGWVNIPATGNVAYFIQTADVSRDSNIPIHANSGAVNFHYDGQGHTITIDNVSSFPGLFMNTDGDEVKNLTISSINSDLVLGAGWFAAADTGSTFTNVSSDGPISTGSGGIVGEADGTTITRAFSSGNIGIYGGGIVGENSVTGTISHSYSTGAISDFAGGIVGAYSSDMVITSAYSLGNIGSRAGGIVGAYSNDVIVSNVYSVGNVGSNAGGIVGTDSNSPFVFNAYAVYGPILGPDFVNQTVYNTLVSNGFFSPVQAQTVLSPLSAWGNCAQVNPSGFYLTAITPVNPCAPPSPTPSPSPSQSASPASDSTTQLAQTGSNPFMGLFIGSATLLSAGIFFLLRKRLARKI